MTLNLFPSTKKELATLYSCHPNTMTKKLREIGIVETKKRLTPKQVRVVFEELGEPSKD